MGIWTNKELLHILSNLDMHIIDAASAELDNEWKAKRVCSSFTRIYCVESGTGFLCYDGRELEMCPGSIYVIPAGLKFGYYCNEHMTKLYFHINILREDNYDYLSGIGKPIILKGKEDIISKINKDYHDSGIFSAVRLKTYLYDIVCEVFEQTIDSLPEIKQYSDMVLFTVDYIKSHLNLSLKISEIAGLLFISESMLQKQFKKEIGIPLGKYIDDQIMIAAEKDLYNNNISIKDISEKYGFCDQFYFSRKFSGIYGVSPIKYKKILHTKA